MPSSSKSSFFLPQVFPKRTSSASIFLFTLLGHILVCSYTFTVLTLMFFFPYVHSWKKCRGPKAGGVMVPACEWVDQRFALDSCLNSCCLKRDWRKQGGCSGWEGPCTPIITGILDRGHIPAAHSMLTTADPFGGNSFWWTWLIPARSEPITPRWTTLQPLSIFSDCLGW